MIRKTQFGFWIVDGDTHIGKWCEGSGRLDHDQNTLPILYRYVRPSDSVIDIGANIGDHAIAYADWVGAHGKVYAFECGNDAFECLQKNLCNRPNVSCIKEAVYSRDGFLEFNLDSKNIGASFISEDSRSTSASMVKCTKLDSFFLPYEKIDYIKIDAEGAEVRILEGARNIITRWNPILVLEVNVSALARNKCSTNDLFDVLSDFRYRWSNLHPSRSDPMQYDIICTPKK